MIGNCGIGDRSFGPRSQTGIRFVELTSLYGDHRRRLEREEVEKPG